MPTFDFIINMLSFQALEHSSGTTICPFADDLCDCLSVLLLFSHSMGQLHPKGRAGCGSALTDVFAGAAGIDMMR